MSIHIQMFQFFQGCMEEIRNQLIYLICFTVYSSDGITFHIIFGGKTHNVSHSLDRSHRSFYIMTELGHQLFPALYRFLFPLMGCPQLLTHYIESFGKFTEYMSLVHFQRSFQITGRYTDSKFFHICKRTYYSSTYI